MKTQDLLEFLTDQKFNDDTFDLKGYLENTNYDDLILIDTSAHTYKYLFHTPNKYAINLYDGNYDHLMDFGKDSFVAPEDVERFLSLHNSDSIVDRLNNATPRGIIKDNYKVRNIYGSYMDTRHVVVSGEFIDGNPLNVYIYVYDMSGRAERIANLADERDETTGLYHGMYFYREIHKQLVLDENWCFVDVLIRNHKILSEWFGMDRGQFLLTNEAELLKKYAIDNGGVVGFMGQDEFCLVCKYDEEKLNNLYEDVKKLVASVSSVDSFWPVFGIAMYDGSVADIREYYNRAAMVSESIQYNSDEHIIIYDYDLHQEYEAEYSIIYDFERAMENKEINFWIQPQIRLPEKKIVGGEALARWRKDGQDVYTPSFFVPILEKYNLVTKMDMFLWEEVCIYIRSLLDKGIKTVPISLNVSRIDILSIDVYGYITGLLDKYNLSNKHIHIEITESAYANNASEIGDTAKKFRENGFSVLMDDFGSGYSSLNMLKSMTFDVIKLDAQFLKINSDDEQKGINIIESIVNMTRGLGTPIIVEGVEKDYQAEYLGELGCQYMQGFYFYKPMPKDDFTKLMSNSKLVDESGFTFKANEELHLREFLDNNIYSDAMLNNIIGPVAFYQWKGEDVDIIRYNEKFFELVGIDTNSFTQRIRGFQKYMPEEDVQKLYGMLQQAKDHHLVGARDVLRAYRPTGEVASVVAQMYFFEEREDGPVFYVSAHDMEELQFDSPSFPGGYYRCSLFDGFQFLYISPNFEKLTGYSEAEIFEQFDGKLINMIHPQDRDRVIEQCKDISERKEIEVDPYRLKHKTKGYIYVAEQNKITDIFGVKCYQAVDIDITDSIVNRNQMGILSAYLRDTVLLLNNRDGKYEYEVLIEDSYMKELLGLNEKELEEALNSGEICKLFEGYNDSIPHQEYTRRFVESINGKFKKVSIRSVSGDYVELMCRSDSVDVEPVEYIVFMHIISDRTAVNLEYICIDY